MVAPWRLVVGSVLWFTSLFLWEFPLIPLPLWSLVATPFDKFMTSLPLTKEGHKKLLNYTWRVTHMTRRALYPEGWRRISLQRVSEMYYGAIFSLKQNSFHSLRKLLVHRKQMVFSCALHRERRWTVTAKNKTFQQEGCLVQNPRKLSRTGERPPCSCVNRSELAHSKVLMLGSGSHVFLLGHQYVFSLSGDDLLL